MSPTVPRSRTTGTISPRSTRPENHPARSMQDTFYVEQGHGARCCARIPRPMQVRYMENAHAADQDHLARAECIRVDSDATHSPMFHQVEGLWIDENVSFADLKGTYHRIPAPVFRARRLSKCASGLPTFRSPSRRLKSTCACRSNGMAGNLRLGPGASERDAQLSGIDPERCIGFAFGMGLDRLAMLRYGVDDLRVSSKATCVFLRSSVSAGDVAMKFSEHWLRTLFDPPLVDGELADTLTMGGLEVEEVPAAPPFSRVVVGRSRCRRSPSRCRSTAHLHCRRR